MNGFLIHLYGPLQAWGDLGVGQLRGAGTHPHRAGVIGLIAGALGIPRGDGRLLDLHASLRTDCARIRPLSQLRDFHTVETNPEKGKTLTSRDYLQDGHFVVLVTGDVNSVREAFEALKHPVFPSFLGRRSCPPALPLLPTPVKHDAYSELISSTMQTAQSFPVAGFGSRRKVKSDEVVVWLDGYFARPELPAGLGEVAHLSHETLRTRLIGASRSYSTSTLTRVVVQAPTLAQHSDDHSAYFNALS